MSYDVNKSVRTNENNNEDMVTVNKVRRFFINIGKYLLYFIISVVILGFILYFWGLYESNIRYSIAEPSIVGMYQNNGDNVRIQGLQNIINDSIATLTIEDFACYKQLNRCESDIVTFLPVLSNYSTMVYASHIDYKVQQWNKDKIILKSISGKTTGVVDLKLKKVTFTNSPSLLSNSQQYKEVVILTDKNEIDKLKRKIIRKGMKRKVFGKI